MQEKEISVFYYPECTGKTHGPSLHLNVNKHYKYWGCDDRFSRAETALNQKSCFFFLFFITVFWLLLKRKMSHLSGHRTEILCKQQDKVFQMQRAGFCSEGHQKW